MTIAIVERRGGVAAVTFAADEPNRSFLLAAERYEQALQLMATCFHIHIRRKLVTDRVISGIALTLREYECMQWAARRKSAWETGRILGVKRRSAAYHLDNARKKLGVRTVMQAVMQLSASNNDLF
ncbi:LuxR C-terminal-related transcriptional regulator [Mesorhizobium newzealandense]|uniref:LuxR C-terminal-related transcriptional regulator n=3 Tax=Mesorhizobium TaxID=68287 RepID=A0ABW4WCY6_9HYPH